METFTDLSRDSARCFRLLLDAMARPGKIVAFSPQLTPPPQLDPGTAALILTLLDFTTPVFLDDTLKVPAVESYIAFHTGAPITPKPGESSFAFIGNAAALTALSTFAQGTHEYPDRSTTVILQVEELGNTGGVELSGPGIRGSRHLSASPVSRNFWRLMQENNRSFPRGVDVVFVAPGKLAACPRSTVSRSLEIA